MGRFFTAITLLAVLLSGCKGSSQEVALLYDSSQVSANANSALLAVIEEDGGDSINILYSTGFLPPESLELDPTNIPNQEGATIVILTYAEVLDGMPEFLDPNDSHNGFVSIAPVGIFSGSLNSGSMIERLDTDAPSADLLQRFAAMVFVDSSIVLPSPTPTPTMTATATPTVTPTPIPPLFSDDFEDGNSNGWTPVTGNWSIVIDPTKVYRQISPQGDGESYAGSSAWTDYSIQADIKVVNFVNTGGFPRIMGRYTDINNYYYALLREGNSLELKKMVGGVYTALATKTFSVVAGTTYILKMELIGPNLKVYVNGNLELSAIDSSISSGKIAIGTSHTVANFDNILVTP